MCIVTYLGDNLKELCAEDDSESDDMDDSDTDSYFDPEDSECAFHEELNKVEEENCDIDENQAMSAVHCAIPAALFAATRVLKPTHEGAAASSFETDGRGTVQELSIVKLEPVSLEHNPGLMYDQVGSPGRSDGEASVQIKSVADEDVGIKSEPESDYVSESGPLPFSLMGREIVDRGEDWTVVKVKEEPMDELISESTDQPSVAENPNKNRTVSRKVKRCMSEAGITGNSDSRTTKRSRSTDD